MITPKRMRVAAWIAALAVPVAYLWFYTPYGMDTTDFGYFYAYAWRILEGQMPYRDFFYIKPAFPLYWHAFWLWLTPYKLQILAGKAGFCLSILAAAWLGSLYLKKLFKFNTLDLPLPVLATASFVFGIHSFPHMPWHTADGVLFCSASLLAGITGWPALAGLFSACAVLCKQSFALVPVALCLVLWTQRKPFGRFLVVLLAMLGLWFVWLWANNAWEPFKSMTTGQLDIREALDAGIYIYFRQNWILPLLALAPLALARISKKKLPCLLDPAWIYLLLLTFWYVCNVYTQQTWIGFGASWPTLFMLLGGIAVIFPGKFLLPLSIGAELPRPRLAASLGLGASLLVAWSVAISGGYKIPAFFAAPLIFSFLLMHWRFLGNTAKLSWGVLLAGIIMFAAGYQYPYVFPVRPLKSAELIYDAGQIYPQASHVYVDRDMLERLAELKALRQKYGANYKTLPGFSFAYYLNNDKPVIASDWLIDWEINGQTDTLYNELVAKDTVVFMERDQLEATRADAYDRAGYTVPQRVRKNWRIIEETPHFVVFRK